MTLLVDTSSRRCTPWWDDDTTAFAFDAISMSSGSVNCPTETAAVRCYHHARMARSLALVAAVVPMLGCGGVTRLVPSDRYTVTAALMLGPGKQPLTACRLILLSRPPAGCGGVEVRGVRVEQVPGARRLSNGATMTDSVRPIGTWDGTALNLTEPPRRATESSISITHLAAEPTPRAAAALQQMLADWQELKRLGIQVMQGSTDGDNVVVLVPVADQHTVRTLEQRYGPVRVSAWLERG